jgi:hypothetical protein
MAFTEKTPEFGPNTALLPGLNNMLDDDDKWKHDKNAGGYAISNLGVLTFGAGGYIAGSTRVEVGTATSASGVEALHLSGNYGDGSVNGAGLRLGFYTGATEVARVRSHNEAPGRSGMSLWTYDNGLGERVHISGDGNVGIGTASPLSLLHLQQPNGAVLTFRVPTAKLNAKIGGIEFKNEYEYVSGIESWAADSTYVDQQDLRFYTFLSTKQERMRITPTGNIGIGTASPAYLLDVGTISGATSNSLRVGSGAGYDSSLLLKEASDGYGFTLRNVNNAGLSIIRHHGDATGVTAFYIERATGIIVQSAPGSYNDSALFNRSGSLVVDEAAKKLYLRYKDSGGVCHSIELGGPYA